LDFVLRVAKAASHIELTQALAGKDFKYGFA
jgi:hypothetical protein